MQGLLAPGYLLRACILINLITFVIYGCDKLFASSGLWRIPEITLLLFAFIGGAYGAGLGMLLFRHRFARRHSRFLCRCLRSCGPVLSYISPYSSKVSYKRRKLH